jgi:predicted transcriptional regulator
MALIKTPGAIEGEPDDTSKQKGVTAPMSLQLLQEDQQNVAIRIKDLVSLKDVIKGVGLLAMRDLDPAHLELFLCSDPATWPPISVTKSNAGYIYYDGQHRIQAGKRFKLETIQANCRTFMNVNDLIEAAFRANLKHGLPASQQTRADYCYWLSVTYPDLTQPQIAARVGVTQSWVSRAIMKRKQQLQEAVKEAKQEQQKEENGDDLEEWKEGVIRRSRTLVKSIGKFSGRVKETEDYYDLVRDLQYEFLRAEEDREALLFTGQLLLDAANRING